MMFWWFKPDWRGCLTRTWAGDMWVLRRDMTVRRIQAFDALFARQRRKL